MSDPTGGVVDEMGVDPPHEVRETVLGDGTPAVVIDGQVYAESDPTAARRRAAVQGIEQEASAWGYIAFVRFVVFPLLVVITLGVAAVLSGAFNWLFR